MSSERIASMTSSSSSSATMAESAASQRQRVQGGERAGPTTTTAAQSSSTSSSSPVFHPHSLVRHYQDTLLALNEQRRAQPQQDLDPMTRQTPGLEVQLQRLRTIARRMTTPGTILVDAADQVVVGEQNDDEQDDDEQDDDEQDDDEDEEAMLDWDDSGHRAYNGDLSHESNEVSQEDRRTGDMLRRRFGRVFDHPISEDEEEDEQHDDDDDDDEDLGMGDPLDAAFWPGLIIERPLNPPGPSPLRTSFIPSLDRLAHSPSPTSYLAPTSTDPSSSTSPTSFLRPGIVFCGTQVFEVRTSPSSSRIDRLSSHPYSHRHLAASSLDPYESARSLAEGTSFLPPLRPSRQASSSSNSTLMHLLSSSTPFQDLARMYPEMAERDAELERQFDARPSLGTGTTDAAVGAEMSPFARARIRREQDVREIRERTARVARPRSAVSGRGPELGAGGDKLEEHERWEVKVIINTYDSSARTITGLMHALGVPASASQVTTYFTGEILDILRDGLWSNPEWGSKRSTDAESWVKLGPFKGLKSSDLLRKSASVEWLDRTTRGYVLMRWKERDFVNVTPAESRLSIAGYYYIMLERSTGQLEGLYHDPVSSPYQRLELSPCTTGARFALGTFSFS